MQLTVPEQPEATPSHPPSPSGGTNGGSLLESAISAMPRSARILIYPSGRNARLALMDLRDKNLLGDRTIVGFADDNPAAQGSDCRTLSEACVEWRPTHVLICARLGTHKREML